MKLTFIHRSKSLVVSTVVRFRRGAVPKKSHLTIHFCDFNVSPDKIEKEFARWIKHVWTETEKAGGKVNWS